MLHQAGTFLTSSYVPKKSLVLKEDNTNPAVSFELFSSILIIEFKLNKYFPESIM